MSKIRIKRRWQLLTDSKFLPNFFDFYYHRTEKGKEWLKLIKYFQDNTKKVISERRKYLGEKISKNEKIGYESISGKAYLDFVDILLLSKFSDGSSFSDK